MKERGNMQKTINKYQSKFDRLMQSIEKDKILKKMPGNATAGIAVQMIKDLKNYLKVKNYPYNLHTLQLATMQEKCWYCLLICNVL